MEIKVDENRKTILFAPNAFGKTILSNNHYKYLLNKGIKTELFTARRIKELVNVKKKDILIGDSSIIKANNIDIEDQYKQSLSLHITDYSKKYYKASNATQLNGASAYFQDKKLTNFRNSYTFFKDLFLDDKKEVNLYLNFDDIVALDKEFFGITIEIPDSSGIIMNDIGLQSDRPIYTDQDYDSILNILAFIRSRGSKKCPVCGQNYESNDDLITHVLSEIKKVSSEKQSQFLKKLVFEWDKINNRHNDLSPLWKIMDKPNKFDVTDLLKKLMVYENIVKDFGYMYKTALIKDFKENSKISVEDFINDANLYNRNIEKIKEEEKNIESNANYMRIVLEEFQKLVDLPDEIKMTESKNYELKVTVDGEEKNPSEVLSESELKRLSLAIIKATIIERKSSYVILDDPIDSYDDYYIKRATKYIYSDLLSEVNNWFVTSHQFQFIQQLSNLYYCNNDNVIIYYSYYDPDYINMKDKIRYPVKKTELIRLNDLNIFVSDEMILLKNIANNRKSKSEYHVDKIFAYLSMACVIRTFKNELVNGYNGIIHVNDRNGKVQKKLNLIEDAFLHYSIDKKASIGLIEYILDKWMITNHKLGFDKRIKNKYMNDIRDIYLLQSFSNIKGSNLVLKDVLYKMLWVSKCKYELDRALYVFCSGDLKWSYDKLKDMLNEKTFSSKLDFVQKDLNKQSDKLDGISDTYNRHKALLNDYSHSASRLFPPYMVTSIKEVRAFYEDVKKLF